MFVRGNTLKQDLNTNKTYFLLIMFKKNAKICLKLFNKILLFFQIFFYISSLGENELIYFRVA